MVWPALRAHSALCQHVSVTTHQTFLDPTVRLILADDERAEADRTHDQHLTVTLARSAAQLAAQQYCGVHRVIVKGPIRVSAYIINIS